jgi:hypothetical protein
MGQITIIGDRSLILSDTFFKNGLTYTPIDFYEQASYIQGPQKKFTDFLRSWNGLLVILKNTLGLNNGPMRIKSSHSKQIGNNEDAKKFSRYISIISNRSIFKIQKPGEVHTSGTGNFHPNLYEFYLVTQSL